MDVCFVIAFQNDSIIINKGSFGLALNVDWREPEDEFSPSDWEASERAMQFQLGWFADPIFGDGDYPHVMRERICNRSLPQGLQQCRLPSFSEEEKRELKGKGNVIGVKLRLNSDAKTKYAFPFF